MLTDVEAREALHVLLLSRLSETEGQAFVLKGGANLRLFFASPRYSEDIDLDVNPNAKQRVVSTISDALSSPWFVKRLHDLNIEGVDYGGRPAKNTDTTVRFKLAVINKGRLRLPTRIEISLRERFPGDPVVAEPPERNVMRRYINPSVERPLIPHYPRDAAMRQKLKALAVRNATQARDVFDLHVLGRGDVRNADLAFLKRVLAQAELEEASARAVGVTYRQFRDQVLEFLPEAERAAEDEVTWQQRQLFVVELVEAILDG